ncbi:hypothetical protein AACH06_04850 [Ideonella sp. DXS29W]|uniref:Uncharacterized protein n=1 Tax=Ideonella lacteola TaxID=2984193 RepID=A0ABU9BJK9_9BURK
MGQAASSSAWPATWGEAAGIWMRLVWPTDMTDASASVIANYCIAGGA